MSLVATVLDITVILGKLALAYYAIALTGTAILVAADVPTPDRDSHAAFRAFGIIWLFAAGLPLVYTLAFIVDLTDPVFPQFGEWVDEKMEVSD